MEKNRENREKFRVKKLFFFIHFLVQIFLIIFMGCPYIDNFINTIIKFNQMNNKIGKQVPKETYYGKYDDLKRFISYYYQIDLVKKLNPYKILEIGVGNKTVSNYLRQNGFNIDTCDFNINLKPDCVADIRSLPFKNDSYDLLIACEILEHIPWEDTKIALNELQRVSKKYVIISVPYSAACFGLIFNFPLINKTINKPWINLSVRIPLFFLKIKFSDQHYWEMGRRGYSLRKVRNIFNKYFEIIEEVSPLLNSYHHFFLLKKYL